MPRKNSSKRFVSFHKSSGGKKSRSKKSSPPKSNGNVVDFQRSYDTTYTQVKQHYPFLPRNTAQANFIKAIHQHKLVMGLGPAGTGKTYCAVSYAAEALAQGRIERIILTRPAVEAGETLGYLPGALNEKYSVYVEAFRDVLEERLGTGAVDYHLRHGKIVTAPLAYMRGKTFGEKTFVILDEAQNTSPTQMKMFLTRIGEGCKVVVNGDLHQSDIAGKNGLEDALNRVAEVPDVCIRHFESQDVVRSGLAKDLLKAYEE